MARSITLTLGAGLGANLGPDFDLTANVGTVTPSTATATELLAGKSVSVDDTASEVTVTSTGTCINAITQTIPCVTTTTTTTTTSPTLVTITVNYESATNVGNITSLEIVGSDGTGYPATITSGTFPLTAVGQSVTATTTHYDGEYDWDTDFPNGIYEPVSWQVRLYYNNIGGVIDKTVATRNGTESVCFGLDSPSGPGATQFGFSAQNLGDSIIINAQSGFC
jgi:hypothetical protein